MGSWFEPRILTSRDGTSVCVFLSWSIPPGIWLLAPASYETHMEGHTTHTRWVFYWTIFKLNNFNAEEAREKTWFGSELIRVQLCWTSDLWCDLLVEALLFASEPLLLLSLLQCQAKDAGVHLLGCNIRFIGKEPFDCKAIISNEVKHYSKLKNIRKTFQNFAIFLISVAKQQLVLVDIGTKCFSLTSKNCQYRRHKFDSVLPRRGSTHEVVIFMWSM